MGTYHMGREVLMKFEIEEGEYQMPRQEWVVEGYSSSLSSMNGYID